MRYARNDRTDAGRGGQGQQAAAAVAPTRGAAHEGITEPAKTRAVSATKST